MVGGVADAGVQAGELFRKLDQVPELRASPGHYDPAIQRLIIQAHLFEMIGNEIHDLAHTCLYDIGQVFHADLFGRHPSQTGYGDIGIGFGLIGQGGAELYFHLFRLCLQYAQAGLDIVGDVLTTEGNDSRMFQDAFIKHGEVGGATSDIDDRDACLQVLISHNRRCGSQGLKDQVFCQQVALFHSPVDIPDGVLIAGNNMKIGSDLYAAVADRVRNILKIIHSEFLRDHVDDLVAGGNIGLVLIGDKLVDLPAGDLVIGILANDVSPGLQALDMMTGNTYVYLGDLQVGIGGIAIIQGHLNGLDRLVYIQHLSMLDTVGISPSKS